MQPIDTIVEMLRLLHQSHRSVTGAELASKLKCDQAVIPQLVSDSQFILGVPITHDPQEDTYSLESLGAEYSEVPGFNYNADEMYALMTSHRLLSELNAGVLQDWLNPLVKRLEKLMESPGTNSAELFDKVRILQTTPRISRFEDFHLIGQALLNRQQLRIQYQSRSEDELTERWISPQRLIFYRDNWYLDAWCHLRNDLRTFSLDRMNVAEAGNKAAELESDALDEYFTRAYGIFSGPAQEKAVIRFSAEVARWVADEAWHPEQEYTQLNDGGCELTVPYSDPRELIMDILKYGPDAEVVSPESLRKQVEKKLSKALRSYRRMH